MKRYFHDPPFNLVSETVSTLNPASSYPTWIAYISAFLKSYHHVISIHPSVGFLRHLLDPLQRLIEKLDTGEVDWVRNLQQEKGLRARLWHRDLHFGNILADPDGVIHGVIDWEFAGTGPSCASRSSPLNDCLAYVRVANFPSSAPDIMSAWPTQFLERLEARNPAVAEKWAYESDRDKVLGKEGQALSDVREYLRSCLEVGVRGWGNVELGKGKWREVVENRLTTLGCL